MIYFLYGLFFLSCIILVAAVLLQPGKTDAGALFTSNISSSAFAPRGTATVLSKITIGAAAAFMVSALLLSLPALTGNVSVLSANPEAPVEQPVDENGNTADGNANSVDTNSNSEPADNTNSAPANAEAPPTTSEPPANN